jgi:hypothetical protein
MCPSPTLERRARLIFSSLAQGCCSFPVWRADTTIIFEDGDQCWHHCSEDTNRVVISTSWIKDRRFLSMRSLAGK